MKKNKIQILIWMISFVLLWPASAVSANSAIRYWSGSDATGAVFLDEDCPVAVQKEVLTFTISEFPQPYYASKEEAENYPATFCTEYTFYNPEAYTVTAELAFPLGDLPDYMPNSSDFDHTEIYVNGEKIPSVSRATFHPEAGLELSNNLERLKGTQKTDPFFTEDLKVTAYTYEITEVFDEEEISNIIVMHTFTMDSAETKILFEPDIASYITPQEVRAELWANQGETFTYYVFGEDTIAQTEWEAYINNKEKTPAEVKVEFKEKQESTFRDYILQFYEIESSYPEEDYFNAAIEAISYYSENGFLLHSPNSIPFPLMIWEEYEIEILPNQTLTNTVQAAIYPDMDHSYDPPVYTYTYYLSPAADWSDFKELDIHILTDYYLQKSSITAFEKDDSGYHLTIDHLPDQELTFRLSTEQTSAKESNPYVYLALISFMVMALALLMLLKWIFKRIRRKN